MKDNSWIERGFIIKIMATSMKDSGIMIEEMEWNNGNKYEGEFKDNKRNGQGTYFWNNGNHYQGKWENDLRHGKGIFIWKSGDW